MKLSQGDRRLAAIMFTDIVGYTSISQRDEEAALQLLEEHRSLIRPFFARHGGSEIKTMGDGFLVEFPSALEAVRCAYEMQQSLHERNADRTPDSKVMVRIGVHLGDVVHSQSDVYGDAVNIASRIQPLSEPGGICVTSQVYDQVRNKFEFPMTTLGKKSLKNVGEPTEVYRVVLPWSKAPESKAPDTGHRVAVLPFTNMSPDPNDEFFADGMTEEVISTMSRIEGIEVISRTSVMQYKKAPKPIREVSKELEVGTVLEGSVRKAGNRLRVTVQMIDAGRDRHVWAESYDRDLQDVFAIQSDIAKRVADALETRIPKDIVIVSEPKQDIDAYTSYMRAMQLYHESTDQSVRESIVLFNHAIAMDPTFARAYAGLAHSYCTLAGLGLEDFSVVNKAETAARKALELGPGVAEAHSAMADVDAYLDRFEEGIAETRRAIELNPNDSEAHVSMAIEYASIGKLDQARESAKRAYELDPLSFRPAMHLGMITLMAGNQDDALAIFNRLQGLHPRNPRALTIQAELHMMSNDFSQAERIMEGAWKMAPDDPVVRLDRGMLYALTGRRNEAEEVLAQIMKSEKESVRLYGQLFINCALGRLDEAFKALMRTAETHSWPYLISVSPLFIALRADPRFAEFRSRVGLPPDTG